MDVIIYCTGYKVLDFDRIDVIGKEGHALAVVMADDPRAHKGIAVPGFPNLFFAVGPNGLVLNVSYFVTAERNIRTIVRLLSELRQAGATSMAVKRDVFERYNAWLSGRFARYSWGSADCRSYYRNAAGHAPFLFPGSFREFRKLQDESGLHEYELAQPA